MAIDFEIPPEAKAVRERVRQWVQDECVPAEKALAEGRDYKELLAELRGKARPQGLWCPFIPTEYGGMGLGPLANALVQMELGASHLGALSMNSQGPDDATMLTLLAHGRRSSSSRCSMAKSASATRGPRRQPGPTPPACRPARSSRATRTMSSTARNGSHRPPAPPTWPWSWP
jgi:alkylation response protein AidB-like acyl-CoA dehydrogenase